MSSSTNPNYISHHDYGKRLDKVRERIAEAAGHCGRLIDSISLIAVSKTFPIEAVNAVAAAGQKAFGENYAQEGVEKASARPDLEWHFIGPIQSNKTRGIAEHFAWVHTIDRLKIAERISAQRPVDLPPIQVCVQVNISGETSKSGCSPDAALALCQAVSALPHLNLRGLMAIPEATTDQQILRYHFAALGQLLADINSADAKLHLDTLSMGMSADLEVAISEGATMVRIGSAIFGQRHYSLSPVLDTSES